MSDKRQPSVSTLSYRESPKTPFHFYMEEDRKIETNLDYKEQTRIAIDAMDCKTEHDNNRNSSPKMDDTFPDEVLFLISSFLDVPSLGRMRSVNRHMQHRLGSDWAGWKHHCELLERNQQFWSALPAAPDVSAMQLYAKGIADGRRQEIRFREVCYDWSRTVWWFRVKTDAGPPWTMNDPWHRGESARRVYFTSKGRVECLDQQHGWGNLVRWCFIHEPLMVTEEKRAVGAYIRLNWNGRDLPTYVVRRNTENGGFIMENCWGIFTTYAMQPKTSSTSEPPHTNTKKRKLNEIQEVTSQMQWREALYYNHGPGRMPHGPGALTQFQRAWAARMGRRPQAAAASQQQEATS